MEFSGCNFNKFLSTSIQVTKDSWLIDKIFELTRQILDTEPISIWNCRFRGYNVYGENGACFNVSYPLEIYNSHFFDIRATNGGAFYSKSSVSLSFCTFDKVSASDNGGIFLIQAPEDQNSPVCIKFTEFTSVNAKEFGIFNREGRGSFEWKMNNITNCVSYSNVGIAHLVCDAPSNIIFSHFEQCKAKIENGGFFIRQTTSFVLDSSIFIKQEQSGSNVDSGTVIRLQDCQSIIQISKIVFYKCSSSKGKTISNTNGAIAQITKCEFSEAKSDSYFPESAFTDKECKYLSKIEPKIEFLNGIGFLLSRYPTPEDPNWTPKNNKIIRNFVPEPVTRTLIADIFLRWSYKLLIVSAGLVVGILLFLMFGAVKKRCKPALASQVFRHENE